MSRHRLHKLRNVVHSAVLIAGMGLIAGVIAWILWGGQGVLWTLGGVALLIAFSPSMPPAAVLSLYRARPLRRAELPEVHEVLDEVARRAGLATVPRLYYLPSAMLNAFTLGRRDHAAIALSDGLLRHMSLLELGGVLAHETAHIVNNDLWIMNLADTMSRVTTLLTYLGLFLLLLNLPAVAMGAVVVPWPVVLLLLLAPTLMSLLQLALSRAREYDADLEGARLLGDPDGLAAALMTMERVQGRILETLIMPGRRVPAPSVLRSHPPTRRRIQRLRDLGATAWPPALPPRAGEREPVPAGTWPVRAAPRWRWSGVWY